MCFLVKVPTCMCFLVKVTTFMCFLVKVPTFIGFLVKVPTFIGFLVKVGKGAKIRNRYNQVPHLTQDTNEKVPNSQSDTTNKSQEVSPFPAGDHMAHINRRAQTHGKHKTEKHKRSTKEAQSWNGQLNIYWRA